MGQAFADGQITPPCHKSVMQFVEQNMRPMNGQTAVITGASGSIGAAIADCLAEEGVKLRLVGRNALALDAVALRAAKLSPQVLTYRCDITDDKELEALAVSLRRDCETLDVLIHCAAIIVGSPIETANIADFDRQYRTNVRGPYVLTQLLIPVLRAHHGSVVFVNSSAAFTTKANVSQYSATKHALKAVADGLREEVNADDIRVMSVYPGRTSGPLQARIFEAEGRQYSPELLIQPGDVARILVDALKVNRTAEVTDIHIRPMRKSY
jgi:NADP-dependent 3-hydroxy acid dehydrogenase YdfG